MFGLGDGFFEDLRAPVAGGLDRHFVTGSEGEVPAMLSSDSLHVLEELMEIQLLGLPLEAVEVDTQAVTPLVRVCETFGNRLVFGSSILGHRGKTKGLR